MYWDNLKQSENLQIILMRLPLHLPDKSHLLLFHRALFLHLYVVISHGICFAHVVFEAPNQKCQVSSLFPLYFLVRAYSLPKR